jgi:CheY-like chemotaxis protein
LPGKRPLTSFDGASVNQRAGTSRDSNLTMSKREGAKLCVAGSPSDPDAIAKDPGTTPGSFPTRRTLLVVEDDPDTQTFMKALLGRYYEVATAASEDEFWAVLGRLTPCVVVMDLTLKGSQDGLTLTRQLRADPRWNSIPVVALTAHVTTEDRERALGAGCAAYVSKPVERRRLLELIRSLIVP